MRKFFCSVLAFVFSTFLFAEIKVISPVEGRWANKQMLVLDTTDGADYFYSLNGDDPELTGFAYDGPVLIDKTGDITLKITRAFEEKTEITFSVQTGLPTNGKNVEAERAFIYTFFDTGMINYFSGNEINIPSSLRYSFEQRAENFFPGKTLSYSEKCSLLRFIPCTITDGKLFWRFVIRTNPKSSGSFSRRDLPFSVKDWRTIVFEDETLLFRIDSEYWNLPRKERVLDRTVPHVIYWQSLSYDVGNPIEFYELPPLPQLVTTTNNDGSISYTLEGDDSYSMTYKSNDFSFYDLWTELNADTFEGDYLCENAEIAVYSDSLFQGTLPVQYEVDKRLPSYPVFNPSISGFHVRGQVQLNVKTSSNNTLFIAVSDPLELEDSNVLPGSDKLKEADNQIYKFKQYTNSADIVLSSAGDKPVYYKVKAYSSSGKKKSDVCEYSVLIDSYSFYFDSEGDSIFADGSKDHPWTSFDQIQQVLKDYRSVRFYIKGTVRLPNTRTELNLNCDIKGLENAVLEFPENASVVVKNSSLQIDGCRMIKSSAASKTATQNLLKLENSVLSCHNCDVFFSGSKNGTLIDSVSSIISISDSTATVTSQIYASFLSGVQSRVSIKNCKAALVSDTTVAVSVRDSDLKCENSSFRVTGVLGRICEFFNSSGSLKDNQWAADLKRSSGAVLPVYKDEKSEVTEISNYSIGF